MWRQLLDISSRDNAIGRKFNELYEKGEGALVAYLTGEDPSPESFEINSAALVEGGADILEVGIPFSDPVADGPIIQASSTRARSHGATPTRILDHIGKLSTHIQVPIVVLTYYNPVLAIGLERFLERARDSGVNGLVIPDLPVEEAEEFVTLASKYSIDGILLAAPNTSAARLRKIVNLTRGFLYLVSLYGVTGPRDALSSQALVTVQRVKKLSAGKIPILAGFGISHPEQVSSLISSGANGAIVGSSLVSIIAQHLDQPDIAAELLKKTVRALKQATKKND